MGEYNFKKYDEIRAIEKLSRRQKWIEQMMNKDMNKQEMLEIFSDFSKEEVQGVFKLLLEIIDPYYQ